MTTKTEERAAFSIAEVATMLGLHHLTIREAIRRGEIAHVRVGRRILVPRTAIDTLLNATGVGGS